MTRWASDLAEELTCEIMLKMAGIRLTRCDDRPETGIEKDVVYGFLDGEQTMQLQLAAGKSFFHRLAANIIGGEPEDEEEVREYAAEFANVLCGRFVSEICRSTNTVARFRPTVYGGGHEACEKLETVHFVSDHQEEITFSWSRDAMAAFLKREMAMKIEVMIVDDSRVVYAEMKKMLADTNFEIVGFCRSGEEALSTYETVKPQVVTMDIVMPGMDGLDAAEELLKKWPDARIVMVSSLAYGDTTGRAKELGTKGFIYKPFDRETLIAALTEAVKDGE